MIYNENYLAGITDIANIVGSAGANAIATAPKTNFWDKLSNTLTKVGNTANQVAPIVSTVKTIAKPGTTTSSQGINTTYGAGPAPIKPGLSTGAKIGIGVAAAAVVTGIIYAVRRKKKNK